uniref:Endoplasmic reticulum lectin n=1 Tax=Tetraodon nigroviridis TaxID=99883 RepID=H3DGQ4_TETNG
LGLLLVLLEGLPGVRATVSVNRGGYPSFSDEIPFKITWPGPEFTLPNSGAFYSEDDFVIMTTAEKEKYKCLLPSLTTGEEDDDKAYTGPSPAELLEPLFKRPSCSYRIESYWTYEVCHGKHVRQYHEEKETGQKVSVQEYFLGNVAQRSQSAETEKVEEEVEDEPKSTVKTEVPTKNIEGQLTPYYSVELGNGTPCTLIQNRARTTAVLYVCHPEAKHEILSVAEVTTCEYEVVVLTPLLCSHPKYRFKASPVNSIFCRALAGSPLRPQRLIQLDKEREEQLKPPLGSAAETREEEASPVKEEASPHKPVTVPGQTQVAVGTTHISRLTDDQLVKEFLSGSYCLHGGVGWWKYEFCYGKYVHQYHEEKEQGKNIVVIGSWNANEHFEWAQKNVARSYQHRDDGVQKVKLVSHFYGHGDVCDLTGKPRQVIVKLKCKESESPHAVTVYMLEPQICQYVLGVESPVICRILDTADEHGLLSVSS